MSKNLVALLIAGALILLSALEITYMSTRSTEPSKQVALPLDEGRTKRVRLRPAVSVSTLLGLSVSRFAYKLSSPLLQY